MRGEQGARSLRAITSAIPASIHFRSVERALRGILATP